MRQPEFKKITSVTEQPDSTFADEREELRWILKMHPIQFDALVRKKFNTPAELMQLTTALTQLENTDYKNWPEDYQKFKTASDSWFKDEKRFYKPALSVYREVDVGGSVDKLKFLHEPPSINYPPLFAEMYKVLGGRLDVSPSEFTAESGRLLREFHGVEFGCGPGFGLKVLRDIGADVTGVDKVHFEERPKGVRIIQRNVLDLDKWKKELRHKPGIVYSLDLIEEEIFDSADEAGKIIEAGNEILDSGGFQIHMVPCVKLSPKVMGLYRRLLKFDKEGKIKLYNEDVRKEWEAGKAMSRSLLLKDEDVWGLAERLGMKVLKNELSSSHWVLWLKKE